MNKNNYNNDNFLELWNKLKKTENNIEMYSTISRIFLCFCFFIFPIFISIIFMIICKSETNKKNILFDELILMMITTSEIYSINELNEHFHLSDIYGSLNRLFNTKLKDFTLSENKLYIIKKGEKNNDL